MPDLPHRPLAVVLDLDGTLVDSAPDMGSAMARVLAAHGHAPLTPAQLRSFIGNGVGALVRRTMAAAGADPAGFDDWHDAYMDRYGEELCVETRLYDGVTAALDDLAAQGHRLGICTNKPQALTEGLLDALGLAPRFGAVLGGDTPLGRKPAPGGLRAVIARLGGEPAVLVGDGLADAGAAQAAGVPFLLFAGGYRDRPASDIPARAVFDDWDALPGLVAAISAPA